MNMFSKVGAHHQIPTFKKPFHMLQMVISLQSCLFIHEQTLLNVEISQLLEYINRPKFNRSTIVLSLFVNEFPFNWI